MKRTPLSRSRKPPTRRKPVRKKTSAQKMKQGLDLVFKELVHERDGGKCLKCGTDKQLQSAHIKPKGTFQRMRFMPLNLLTLCWHDHCEWAHKDPLAFTAWFNEKWPGREDALNDIARTAPKLDIKAMYERFKPEIDRLLMEARKK